MISWCLGFVVKVACGEKSDWSPFDARAFLLTCYISIGVFADFLSVPILSVFFKGLLSVGLF